METIGKYKIIRELGSGGFGAVYLCSDALGNQVAIKIFKPKDDVIAGMATSATGDAGEVLKQRFQEEAKILHDLSENPYIVNFMHYDETEDGTPYYVMPYLSHSLVEEIGKDAFSLGAREDLDPELYPRKLTLPRSIEVLEQTAKALSTVHKAGLVHRDIKPANLLINKKGDVQLCDFGIAKLPDADHSQSGVGMGSRNYMSPEQRESAKHVKPSSDIYSLGVIAYRLVTGTLPIGHFDEPIELRPSVGKEFNRYILQCLRFEAEQRPQDAQSFLQGLIQSSKSIDSQTPEPTDDTSTQMGVNDFSTIKDELKPLRDEIHKLLEAHGDIPEEEMPALHITASMGDLDTQGLEVLIEEVFITNQKTLKPKRKLRELIKKRASTERSLSEGEYQAYLTQITNVGWNETKLKGLLSEAGLHVQSAKQVTKEKTQIIEKKTNVASKAKIKPAGSSNEHAAKIKTNKLFGGVLLVILLVGSLWLSKSDNTLEPIVNTLETDEKTTTRVETGATLDVAINKKKSDFEELELALDLLNIPAGQFQMGSNDKYDDEKPIHQVSVSTFKMMANELTWAQYEPCIFAGWCESDGDMGWGRDNRPVINVSWKDAQTYALWLSKQTGRPYRLPSEAEWEYAARAGSTTKYSWGNTINHDLANYGTDEGRDGKAEGKDKWLNTSPVGSFKANAFGLYDMHGNVWEWTQDCENRSYSGAPSTGKAWDSGDCTSHVLRGGSWRGGPDDLRSSVRSSMTSAERRSYYYGSFGFRLVQGS